MQLFKRNEQRNLSKTVLGAILAGSTFVLAATPGYAAIQVHAASAYGAEVNVGTTVKLGPIAPSILPVCSTQSVGSDTATAASVSQTGLINTGVVNTSASSTATSSTGVADVYGVNLLGGLITANEIKSVSTTSVNGSGVYSFSSAGTEFVNLAVLGIPITVNPAPNTTIDLPLIGSVVLNEQISLTNSGGASLTVNAIHIKVTLANTLGIKVGTEVIVSDAYSKETRVANPGAVGGYAYAPQLIAGPISSGPLVQILIPCNGTNGVVKSDTVAGVNIPGVLTTGTVTVTGMGNVNNTESTSQATTSLAGVNLLSGLASATALDATATGVSTGNGTSFDFTGGTVFTGISIAGHPEITVNVAPNTKINIANLGILTINRVSKYSDKVLVIPLELVVNTTNTLGLPIGADIRIGAAEAQLHSASIP
jgi:hypothetical protein